MGQATSIDGASVTGSAPPHHTSQMDVETVEPLVAESRSTEESEDYIAAKNAAFGSADEGRPALDAAGKQKSFRRKTSRRPSFRGSRALASNVSDLFEMQPIDGIMPLIKGSAPKGVVVHPRPEPSFKSIPTFAPYRRMARHRAFYLYWLNQFRHWWKSSRLLVRLGGLIVFAADALIWEQLTTANLKRRKGRKRAAKLSKHLGQGGPMHWFLQICRPFTRTVRIVVAVWRWIEAAKPRRREVGVEEAMVSAVIHACRVVTCVSHSCLRHFLPISNAGLHGEQMFPFIDKRVCRLFYALDDDTTVCSLYPMEMD
jgi:hypothetical protein